MFALGAGLLAAEQLIDSPAESPVLIPAVGRPLLSPVAAEEFSGERERSSCTVPFLS